MLFCFRNENVKFETERFKKVLKQSKKSSISVESSEDTVQEEKECKLFHSIIT
jgi:hypothetical protein